MKLNMKFQHFTERWAYRESRIVVVVLSVIFAVLAFYFWTFPWLASQPQSNWGVFGDYFGGVLNPLLGCINMFLVIQALTLQRQGSMEAALFELMRQREEIVKSFTYNGQTGISATCDAYKESVNHQRPLYSMPSVSKNGASGPEYEAIERIKQKEIKSEFDRLGKVMPQIFTLLCIVELIGRARLPKDSKGFYGRLVRYLLRDEELKLCLLYFLLVDKNHDNLVNASRLFEELTLDPQDILQTNPADVRHRFGITVSEQKIVSKRSPDEVCSIEN